MMDLIRRLSGQPLCVSRYKVHDRDELAVLRKEAIIMKNQNILQGLKDRAKDKA